jgi:hypothetical protein
MLKKYMIFGSVVLLLAALLTMTGCSQATDSDGGTLTYSENYLYGDSNEDDVRIAVAAARSGNRNVVLGENLRLTGSQVANVPLAANSGAVADFEDMPVRVERNVRVTNMIVNAAFASLSFEPGASITLGAGAVFIYSGEPDDKTLIIDGGDKVKYVTNPLMGTQGTDQGIAVLDYTVKDNFNDLHPRITNLYVLKTLTINAQSTAQPGSGNVAGTPRIFALGTVDLAGSNSLVFANLANFRFTTSAVLTSQVPGVVLTLPNTSVNLPTIEAAVPINIAGPALGAINNLTIADVKGPSTVTISPATGFGMGNLRITNVSSGGKLAVVSPEVIGTVRIDDNAGSISLTAANLGAAADAFGEISGNPGANPGLRNTGTLSITTPSNITEGVIVLSNGGVIEIDAPGVNTAAIDIKANADTGEVIFKRNFTVDGAYMLAARKNDGTILFQGRLNTTAALGDDIPANAANNIKGSGTVEFTGLTTFGGATNLDTKTVFNGGLTTAADLAFGGDVTLANGRGIAQTGGGAAITLKGGVKLLVGDVEVLAGGAAGAAIGGSTILTAGVPDPDDDESLTYKTLTLGPGPVTVTGELRILRTGVLENNVAITVPAAGALTLEQDAILLAPAAGSVNLVNTTIQGVGANAANASQLIALGGAVRLTPNTITGEGSTLQVPEELANDPLINVNGAAGSILTLQGVNLDLQFGGRLNLSNSNELMLKDGTNPGKLTLGEDDTPYVGALASLEVTTPNVNANIGTIRGSGSLLGGDELPFSIGVLSGVEKGWVAVTAPAGGLSIEAGTRVDD